MLIIDMPMPMDCADCPMVALSDRGVICLCTEALLETDFCKERPSWCPIKGELPDEHGDLIDRDALFLKYREQYDFVDEEDILNAKAIIAAERKDDEQIH